MSKGEEAWADGAHLAGDGEKTVAGTQAFEEV